MDPPGHYGRTPFVLTAIFSKAVHVHGFYLVFGTQDSTCVTHADLYIISPASSQGWT